MKKEPQLNGAPFVFLSLKLKVHGESANSS